MNRSSKLLVRLKDLPSASTRSIYVTKALGDEPKSIFSRVFGDNVAKATQSHSVLLANQQVLYELQSKLVSYIWCHFNFSKVIFNLLGSYMTY